MSYSNWENNNILDVFIKYNVVFAGLSEESIDNYKKFDIGTKIAVTDGFTIKAVGETIEEFTSLDKLDIDFTEEELSKFKVENWVLAVKVKLYKLEEKDWGWYDAAYGRISIINKREDIKQFIDEKIKKYSESL